MHYVNSHPGTVGVQRMKVRGCDITVRKYAGWFMNSLSYRGIVLVYLVLEQDQFSRFDAYYFPEESIPVSRMSEPKNFFGGYKAPVSIPPDMMRPVAGWARL